MVDPVCRAWNLIDAGLMLVGGRCFIAALP